ncbi:MAG: hypothetical protein WCC95_01720 [Candidatus Sulfotelmatobacter sp.]
MLRPAKRLPSLVERNGFIVHTGEATRPIEWEDLSDDLERERMKDILG